MNNGHMVAQLEPHPMAIKLNDDITVMLRSHPMTQLPICTLLESLRDGITVAYGVGEEGNPTEEHVYWIPWESILYLTKVVTEQPKDS